MMIRSIRWKDYKTGTKAYLEDPLILPNAKFSKSNPYTSRLYLQTTAFFCWVFSKTA